MRRLLPFLWLLAACAEPPRLDGRIPEAERLAAPPALLPLGSVLAAADALPAAPGFVPALRAEAADLQASAAALPAGGTADPALAARAAELQARAGALPAAETSGDAQRLAELEARAEALRGEGLTEAERDRLLSGAGGS